MVEQGSPLPDVSVTMPNGDAVPLASFTGHPLVLYFYPKDDTSGCTKEAQDFSALMPVFTEAGIAVLGVSRDPAKSKTKFIEKYELTVPLATDEGAVSEAFGTWVEKSMYGRKYMGMDRSTFLFDAGGICVQAWRKVKVPGHAEAVLKAAQALPA